MLSGLHRSLLADVLAIRPPYPLDHRRYAVKAHGLAMRLVVARWIMASERCG